MSQLGHDRLRSGAYFTQGDTSPIMGGTDGYLYNHEPVGDTFNDNGNPLTWTMTLSPCALKEGLQNLDIEGILWDFFQQSGSCRVGLAPTGKRRLSTAHANSGHSQVAGRRSQPLPHLRNSDWRTYVI